VNKQSTSLLNIKITRRVCWLQAPGIQDVADAICQNETLGAKIIQPEGLTWVREYLLNESITWFTWSSEGNVPASMARRTDVDVSMLNIYVYLSKPEMRRHGCRSWPEPGI